MWGHSICARASLFSATLTATIMISFLERTVQMSKDGVFFYLQKAENSLPVCPGPQATHFQETAEPREIEVF